MSGKILTTQRLSTIAVIALLAAGCAGRDSITVGSVPDDYRTNHPIVISEKEKTIDIPVGIADRAPSRMQKAAADGFIAGYDRSAAPVVSVMVPHNSGNAIAASNVAAGLVRQLRAAGVPEGRILHQPYEASQYGDNAPIRLAYAEMRASTSPCGRWPSDMLENTQNRHWENFGCSYQNNIAAQIANPADLLGPRQSGTIDAQNRSHAIDRYRQRGIAGDVSGNREIYY